VLGIYFSTYLMIVVLSYLGSGDSTLILRNIRNYTCIDKVSHLRRLESLARLAWKSHLLHIDLDSYSVINICPDAVYQRSSCKVILCDRTHTSIGTTTQSTTSSCFYTVWFRSHYNVLLPFLSLFLKLCPENIFCPRCSCLTVAVIVFFLID
jgi:hypothetical protein